MLMVNTMMKFIINSQLHLNIIVGIAPCKGLQDTLLDSGFYAVDSEFLELDSGLCFPNSRAVFWIPEGKFLRFRIPRQAKISPHSAIRMFEMERLVKVKSIIKKKKEKKKQQQQQQQKC